MNPHPYIRDTAWVCLYGQLSEMKRPDCAVLPKKRFRRRCEKPVSALVPERHIVHITGYMLSSTRQNSEKYCPMNTSSSESKCDIYLLLAELFFLDTEQDKRSFESAAAVLNAHSWDREKILTVLLAIAPIAGGNVGYLIYPVVGRWAGFDPQDLCKKVDESLLRRQHSPTWYFYLLDHYSMWMLKKLDVDRLLTLCRSNTP